MKSVRWRRRASALIIRMAAHGAELTGIGGVEADKPRP
jgi:hypothetical protein